MSKEYADMFGTTVKPPRQVLRTWLQPKFEYDAQGKPVYMTEQAHKEQCDVNKIIRKYDKTGLISHVSEFNAEYGDVSGIDFKESLDRVIKVREKFDALPSHIRKRFSNNPKFLLDFMGDASNRDEAIKLGLIRNDWTPETDGIGEKVPKGTNVVKKPDKAVETPKGD